MAACVFFDAEGPVKSDYRRFNIENVAAGDDYGALTQALERRYRRVKEGEGRLPDVLLIDGGKGQLNAALEALDEVGMTVPIAGLAKENEELFLPGQSFPVILPRDAQALFLVQRVRDEAHRFAVTFHRERRGKSRLRSALLDVPGVGETTVRKLLKSFGSLESVKNRSVDELARVVNRTQAENIWRHFGESRTEVPVASLSE